MSVAPPVGGAGLPFFLISHASMRKLRLAVNERVLLWGPAPTAAIPGEAAEDSDVDARFCDRSFTAENYLVGRGAVVSATLHGRSITMRISTIQPTEETFQAAPPSGLFLVTGDTKVSIMSPTDETQPPPPPPAAAAVDDHHRHGESESWSSERLEDAVARVAAQVGGCERAIRIAVQAVGWALYCGEEFEAYGLTPPAGVLLYGPPGTGKTLLARAICDALGVHMIVVDAPELVGAEYGECERRVRDIFGEGRTRGRSLLFIDEIDVISPRRAQGGGEMERRLIGALCRELDSLTGAAGSGGETKRQGRMMLLAATNRPDDIDPALRRPGRLDHEVEMGVPTREGRCRILDIMLRRAGCVLTEAQLDHLSMLTHGTVGADLSLVVNQALVAMLRRRRQDGGEASASAAGAVDLEQMLVDLEASARRVKPSALRELVIEVPRVQWSEIGGQEEAKQALEEAVEWPLRHPEAFERMGIRPPAGVLLYGPPGCSKTLMAKALATAAQLNFIAVKGPELFRKWVGDSEKAVANVFRKARQAAPSIIFFDEVDALAAHRSSGGDSSASQRVVSQLLNEMDGITPLKQVVVVAATNRPDMLDSAFVRPGRIDRGNAVPGGYGVMHRLIYVAPPDLRSRSDIFQIHLSKMPLASDVDITALAERSDGFSGAEIAHVCREAGMQAIETDAEEVSQGMLEAALGAVKPQITPEMLAFYRAFAARHSRAVA